LIDLLHITNIYQYTNINTNSRPNTVLVKSISIYQ